MPENDAPLEPAGAMNTSQAAQAIEGLLDDTGQFNPDPDRPSRAHPEYEGDDQPRDERGRYAAREEDSEEIPEGDDPDADLEEPQAADDADEDTTDSAVEETEEDQTDTDGPAIETLTDLADALEMPFEDMLGAMKQTVNVNGEKFEVTLDELTRGYQKDADYRQAKSKLADDRRDAEADFAARVQQVEQHNINLAQTLQAAEQLIAAELNSPQMHELRQSDPSEWNARQTEIGTRMGALQNMRNQAAANYQQMLQTQQTQLSQRESTALKEALPDWSKSHQDAARETMSSLGYSDAEIGQVFDHRLILATLELAALRQEVTDLRAQKSDAAEKVKQVKKDVPKLTKPGKKSSRPKAVKRDNVSRLRDRAKKSGNLRDAAAAIEHLI